MREDLTILRHRRFLLLFSARTIAVLGNSFGPVALAFGVLRLPGATASTLSLVLAANAVALVAFLLFGGVIADRLSRYRVMVGADLVTAVAWSAVAAMLLTGWAPVPLLALAAAAAGVAAAMFFPAMVGVVPEVIEADRLQAANGLLRMGTNGARVLGFALAGSAVALVGPGWAMAVNAAAFAVSAALLVQLRLPTTARGSASRMLTDLREGWREFSSRQWLWVVVLQFSFLVAGLQAAFGVLGPVVADRELGGAPAWSAVLAGEAIGMFVGVLIAIRIRPRRPILLGVLLTFPLAAVPLLLGLGAPLWTVVVGAFVGGLAIDIFGVLWETTMQREVPAEALSRVSSYDGLGSLMFGPLGLVAAGPLAAALGPRPALLVAAVVMLVPTALALLSPGVRGLRAVPAGPGPLPAAELAPDGEPAADPAPDGKFPADPAPDGESAADPRAAPPVAAPAGLG